MYIIDTIRFFFILYPCITAHQPASKDEWRCAYFCNQVHYAFSGPMTLNLFLSFSFLIGRKFYGLNLWSCYIKPVHLACMTPPPPTSVPTEAAELLGTAAWAPMGLILQGRACKYYFLWLLFLTDVNDVCYHVHNMP